MSSWLRRLGPSGAVLLLATIGGAGLLAYDHWRTSGLTAVSRGERLAQTRGCFGCHGPGGLTGFEDPSGTTGSVPLFSNEGVEGHSRTAGEIREWILEGKPKRLRDQQAGEDADEEDELFTMPSFRGRISAAQADDLVAYVRAASNFHASTAPVAVQGREAAARLGCFVCHGPQGRGALPNPGSFKGYIPPWDGPDLPELAKDDVELREWILDGSCKRLREHPIAKRFIQGQAVQMPAYRGHISTEDVDRLVAYVNWLRTSTEGREGR